MKHPPSNIDQSCFDWQKIILQKTDLPSNAKYMALYLATYMNLNRDVAWPSQKTIERETGLSHPSVLKYLDLLTSEGWIGKQSGNRVESNRYWITFPNEVGKEFTYVTSGEKVGKEVTSNNNTNNNTTTTTRKKPKFVPPTVEEVKQYCTEKSMKVDPDYFFSFYDEGGWKDAGGKPVRSWKQKLITWNKRELTNEKPGNSNKSNTRGPEVINLSHLVN